MSDKVLETRVDTPLIVADSVILGGFSCIVESAVLGTALLARRGYLTGDTITDMAGVGFLAAPVLALLNLVFVGRDWQAEQWRASIAGAVLSGITIFLALVSLALAD